MSGAVSEKGEEDDEELLKGEYGDSGAADVSKEEEMELLGVEQDDEKEEEDENAADDAAAGAEAMDASAAQAVGNDEPAKLKRKRLEEEEERLSEKVKKSTISTAEERRLEQEQAAGENSKFDFKASPFASFAASSKSTFANVTSSKPSPFANLEGQKSAFGELAEQHGSIFGKKEDSNAESNGLEGMKETEGDNGENGNATQESCEEEQVFQKKSSSGPQTSGTAEEIEQITGEEDEECIFKIRAKLYKLTEVMEEKTENGSAGANSQIGSTAAFDSLSSSSTSLSKIETFSKEDEVTENDEKLQEKSSLKTVKKEYKELGAGFVHVNLPRKRSESLEDNGTAEEHLPRLVMRREGVLKLLLNAVIWKSMPIERASDKMIRFTCQSVLEDMKVQGPETYLLKLPRADQCEELFKAVRKAMDLSGK